VFGFILFGLPHIQQRESVSGRVIHVIFGRSRIERFYRGEKLFPAHGAHPLSVWKIFAGRLFVW
jgi:hypothetical protein